MTNKYQRWTAALLTCSLSLGLINCSAETTSSARQYATGSGDPTQLVCNNDDVQKLKRKLELRRMTLKDEISSAESEIKVNDAKITTNTGTIAAATDYLSKINDGFNDPPTDPAQESFVGRKHLLDLIDAADKFPVTAIGKFGLFCLVAALEAITLKAAGKAVTNRLCTSSVTRAAEKAALTEAAKQASMKSVSMLKKFWSKFGKARLVVGGAGVIGLPMKARWDLKGDTLETWIPVYGTLKIGAENLGTEFTAWMKRDEIKAVLKTALDELDAEIKRVQDVVKAKTDENTALVKENTTHAANILKFKTELAKVEAALAKLGGASVCFCEPVLDPTLIVATTDPIVTDTSSTAPVATADMLDAGMPSTDTTTVTADASGASDGSGASSGTTVGSGGSTVVNESDSSAPTADDFVSWSLDELLADIDLSDAALTSSEVLIWDEFDLCDDDGVCAPI